MIIQRATTFDLLMFYGHQLSCDYMDALALFKDGVVVGIAGLCRWHNKVSICISDFKDGVTKSEIVTFGRYAMSMIEAYNEEVYAICETEQSTHLMQRLGFCLSQRVHDRNVMLFKPRFDFGIFVRQMGLIPENYTTREIAELIEYATKTQLESILPTLESSAKHYFCNGTYVKEMLIPAGTLMVSKVHKTEHLSIMTSGDVTVLCETGHVRYQGHNVIHSMSGIKRIGLFHADTLWMNVHKTNGITDIDEMTDYLVTDSDLSWIAPCLVH